MNEILYYISRYERTHKQTLYWAAFSISVQLQVDKYAEEVVVINFYYAQLKNNSFI